jgi:ribosomal protein L19
MKLNKNCLKNINNYEIYKKFLNCSPSSLKRGDYILLHFFIYDDIKKGGTKARLNKITGILLKKKIRVNNTTLLVSTMYKNEKVRWRF